MPLRSGSNRTLVQSWGLTPPCLPRLPPPPCNPLLPKVQFSRAFASFQVPQQAPLVDFVMAPKISASSVSMALEASNYERDFAAAALWRRVYWALEDRLVEEGDEAEVVRSKVAVCVTAALCGCCGVLWALCYGLLGAFVAAVFPGLWVLVCLFSATYLLRTRRLPLARSALCHGLAITALGIHWAFGGSGASSAVASWAVLGPQVLRTTGAGVPECVALLAGLGLALTASGFVETFGGAELMTPQRVAVPVGWEIALCWLNILCPGVVSFLATNLVLNQLQVTKDLLEEAMLAQKTLHDKASCERQLAYQLVTHTFPEAIAGELFKFFHSRADEYARLQDFVCSGSPRDAPPRPPSPRPPPPARKGELSTLSTPTPSTQSFQTLPSLPGSTVTVSGDECEEEGARSPGGKTRYSSTVGAYFSAFGGRHHRFTVITFADLVGFTALSSVTAPARLVQYLDVLFGRFDDLCLKHRVEKIKTIGDCYMCVAWEEDHKSRTDAAMSSLAVAAQMHEVVAQHPLDGTLLQMRVGLHCGPVVGGIIGKTKFCYDIWGDTVNLASRMESTGQPGSTHVSADLHRIVKDEEVAFIPRGPVDVKGKGKLETYFVLSGVASDAAKRSPRDAKEATREARPLQGLYQMFDLLQAPPGKAMSPRRRAIASSKKEEEELRRRMAYAPSGEESPRTRMEESRSRRLATLAPMISTEEASSSSTSIGEFDSPNSDKPSSSVAIPLSPLISLPGVSGRCKRAAPIHVSASGTMKALRCSLRPSAPAGAMPWEVVAPYEGRQSEEADLDDDKPMRRLESQQIVQIIEPPQYAAETTTHG